MSVDEEINIIGLSNTFEAFGMAIDYLSRTETFDGFELGSISAAVRTQLRQNCNLAAVKGNEMVGYLGWLYTTSEQAEDWIENRGLLGPVPKDEATAVALTILASTDPKATTRLIRGGRELGKGVQIYFKRGYDTVLKPSRKSTVLNTSYS